MAWTIFPVSQREREVQGSAEGSERKAGMELHGRPRSATLAIRLPHPAEYDYNFKSEAQQRTIHSSAKAERVSWKHCDWQLSGQGQTMGYPRPDPDLLPPQHVSAVGRLSSSAHSVKTQESDPALRQPRRHLRVSQDHLLASDLTSP